MKQQRNGYLQSKSKPSLMRRSKGMRLGLEDRNKVYSMLLLSSLALVLLMRMFLSGSEPTVVAAAGSSHFTALNHSETPTSDQLILRTDLLKSSEESVYTGSGRNIFEIEAPVEPATPQPVAPVIVSALPPPSPPPPPPIPLKYFGRGGERGEPPSIFLTSSESVFIAREGEIVDRRYKILHISPTQIEVEDILTAHRETLTLSHE